MRHLQPTNDNGGQNPPLDLKSSKSRQDLLTNQLAKQLAHETFFVVHEVAGQSTLSVDKANNISRVSWVGDVDFQTASAMLRQGADSVEFEGYSKLLIDGSALTGFDTEARVWIKDFLSSRAKSLSSNVQKLAVVAAKSKKGNIFGRMLTVAITENMPSLNIRKCKSPEEGIEWLLQ